MTTQIYVEDDSVDGSAGTKALGFHLRIGRFFILFGAGIRSE